MGFRLVVGKTATYFYILTTEMELSVDKAPAKHSDGKGGYFFAYKLENATGDVSKHVLFGYRRFAVRKSINSTQEEFSKKHGKK